MLEDNGKTLAIVQCVESRPCSLIIRNMYNTKPKTSFYLEILVPSTYKNNPWLNKHPTLHYGKKKITQKSCWSGQPRVSLDDPLCISPSGQLLHLYWNYVTPRLDCGLVNDKDHTTHASIINACHKIDATESS